MREPEEPLLAHFFSRNKRSKGGVDFLWIALFIALVLWLLLTPQSIVHAKEPIPIPETIRVRITGRDLCGAGKFSHVEVMDFKEYVKGALAAEWGNRWHTNSLRVGAVAVKMYAISAIEQDGKWPAMPWAQDRVGDVYDCNWDQVYKPEWRTAKSDKAVDDTWDYLLVDDSGKTYRTYHKAWEFGCLIGNPPGQCISQWDSLHHAREGIDWKNILLSHYKKSMLVYPDGSTQVKIDPLLDYQKVEGEYDTYLVNAGDTLIGIADLLNDVQITSLIGGEEITYMQIFNLNADILRSPDLIYTGQYLSIPDLGE